MDSEIFEAPRFSTFKYDNRSFVSAATNLSAEPAEIKANMPPF